MSEKSKIIVVSGRPLDDYLVEIVLSFQEGFDTVVVKGYGPNASRVADLYNAVVGRLKDSVEIEEISIGSDRVGRRMKSYLSFRLRRKF